MAHFTVHDVPDRRFRGAEGRETKTVLVKEGFSWGALSLPGVWFLGKGHAVSFLTYLAVMAGVGLVSFYFTNSLKIAAAALLATHLMAAFEANRWRRYLLKRRGAPVIDMATGSTARAALRAYSTEIKAPTFDLPSGQPDLNRLREFDEQPIGVEETPKPRLPDPPPQPATARGRSRRASPTPAPAAQAPSSGFDAIMQFAGLRDRPFVADYANASEPHWQEGPRTMGERHMGGETEDHRRVNIGRRRRRRR